MGLQMICRTTRKLFSYRDFGCKEGATKWKKQQKTDRTQRATLQLSVGAKCTCRNWKKPRANTGARSLRAHHAPASTLKRKRRSPARKLEIYKARTSARLPAKPKT